jgi:hypothetical protein
MKQASERKNETASAGQQIQQKGTVQSVLPPGVKFDDIYMDASQVAQELNISKRVVRNIRISGKISYTNPFGKVFYYRQEIAALLELNKKNKKH